MSFRPNYSRVEPPTYRPLEGDEIRVLILEPGSDHDALEASLQTVSLEDHPLYSAISYVWGPPEFDHSIRLPAEPKDITSSLHGALAAFRRRETTVRLWADAICINQKDQTGELNHQLRLMDRIYRQAAQVLVWLGQPTGSDSLAFASIQILAAVEEDKGRIGFLCDGDQCEEPLREFNKRLDSYRGRYRCSCCNWTYEIGKASSTLAFDALANLWKKDWFFRIWTCQESVLAERCIFYCGPLHATREAVGAAARMHRKLCDSLDHGRWHPSLTSHVGQKKLASQVIAIDDYREGWLTWAKERPREYLLHLLFLRASGRQTAHLPDIIYGIRGLTCLSIESSLDDYSTIELCELFKRVSVAALRLQSNERVGPACALALAAINPTIPPRRKPFPSWAMEIDKFRLEAMLKFRHYINESERQRAGGPSPRMPVFFPQYEKNVCYVQGIFNSKVTDILPQSNRPCEQYYCGTLTKKTLFTDYIQKRLMPWYIRCRHYALSTRSEHKTLQQSFYQLLVQGRDIEQFSLELGSDLFPLFNTLLNRAYTQSMKTSQPLPMFEDLYLDDVVHDLAPFLTPNMLPVEIDPWRRLGVTQEGRMAWMPELTEVGDEVWLVKGAPFPFVFRNVGRGYKALVGDAYLHEAQNGEAWPKDEIGLQGIKIV